MVRQDSLHRPNGHVNPSFTHSQDTITVTRFN